MVLHVLVVIVNGNDVLLGCNWAFIRERPFWGTKPCGNIKKSTLPHDMFNTSTQKWKQWVGREKGRWQNIPNRWWIKRRDQK
jgi:hypothetical protein